MSNGIETKFEKMGARVKVTRVPVDPRPGDWNGLRRFPPTPSQRLRVDVRRDAKGEFFEVRHRADVTLIAVDVRPKDRHLLLLAKAQPRGDGASLHGKFLCGHDERAWFVAAIPESTPANDVQGAMDALKPAEVWESIREHGVRPQDRNRRRTAAFVRQGEWFFIPRPHLKVRENAVLKNEPIRRGAGKPHLCQFLYRTGGQVVYVNGRYPNGLTFSEWQALPEVERKGGIGNWRQMHRDARAYVRGSVRHGDHETVLLDGWHQVVMNTETKAIAMRQVAFLD